jgi:hypothetical protein
MATLIPFTCFQTDFAGGLHDLESDVLKMALSAGEYDSVEEVYLPLPLNKTNWNSTDFPELFGSLSYPSGGYILEKTKYTESEGVYSLFLKNMEFLCPENQFFGPFRYLIIYNSSKSDRLIGYYDYTEVKELNSGESFFVDFDPEKINPAILVDTIGTLAPTPSPTPTPPPTPIYPYGFTFLDQTGTGDYVGTYTGNGVANTPKLVVTMLSDGVTKYMNFKAERNGILYYNYKVVDPDKTKATASMLINGYQQQSANLFTGTIYGSVIINVNHPVVFSFNSGYIPTGETSVASAIFTLNIVEPD